MGSARDEVVGESKRNLGEGSCTAGDDHHALVHERTGRDGGAEVAVVMDHVGRFGKIVQGLVGLAGEHLLGPVRHDQVHLGGGRLENAEKVEGVGNSAATADGDHDAPRARIRHVGHGTARERMAMLAAMTDSATWSAACDAFNGGAYWDAHEILEPAWLASQGVERHFLAGVILLAAALHKARAGGSPRGGRRNFAKALRHLAVVPDGYGGVRVRDLEADVHAALRDAAQLPQLPGFAHAGEDAE